MSNNEINFHKYGFHVWNRDMLHLTNVPFGTTEMLRQMSEHCKLFTTGRNRDHNRKCKMRAITKKQEYLTPCEVLILDKIEQSILAQACKKQ